MSKLMKQILSTFVLMFFALVSPKLYANKPVPGQQSGVHFCTPWPSCMYAPPSCTSGTDCPQACDTITVNTATLGTTGCYPSTNTDASKKSCGLDSAIALANNCPTTSNITFDDSLFHPSSPPAPSVTITAPFSIDPKSSVTIDGGDGKRVTIKASAASQTNALDINGTNGGTVTIKNLYFSGFSPTSTGLIKLEANAKGHRNSGNNADNAAKIYDPSLASANNSDPNVPLFFSYAFDSTAGKKVQTVFAMLTVDKVSDFKKKLQFIKTSSTSDFDTTSLTLSPPPKINGNVGDYESDVRITPLKNTAGTDPSAGAKVLVEGILVGVIPDKNVQYHVLINNEDATKSYNVNFINGDPITNVDTDGDGIADSLETAFGTEPNTPNKPEDFNKFFYTTSAGGLAPCTDGTKFVDCGTFSVAALSASQTPASPGAGSPGTGGCSSLVQESSSNNLTPFFYMGGMALCLGLFVGRRFRLGRVRK